MPEYSNYVEALDAATTTTGTILIAVSHDGDAEKMTPAQLADAAGVVNHYRGDYAGTTTMPTTGGTFTGGVPAAGNEWRLTAQLVIGGNVYPAGTIIKAAINTPGQTLTNWIFLAIQL